MNQPRRFHPSSGLCLNSSLFLLGLFGLLGLSGLEDSHARYEGESRDRMADRVALESQEQALARTEKLMKDAPPNESRALLLWRLAEQHSRIASLHARIAHAFPKVSAAPAAGRPQSAHQALQRSNQRLTQLLEMNDTEVNESLRIQAHFLRGNQRLELVEKVGAKQDLEWVMTHGSAADEAASARLALSGMLAEDQKYDSVIQVLQPLRVKTADPRQGLALYRSAWAAFNLTQFEKALEWVRSHTEVLAQAEAGSSDQVIRENLILDAALFYAEAIERNDPCCRIENALSRFRLLGKGIPLAKMGLRLGKLLRSHRRVSELENLSQQLLAQAPQQLESLEVLLLILEDGLNHHRFQDLARTALRISAHAKALSPAVYPKAILPLSETLEKLTLLAQKNREASGVAVLLSAHVELSQAVLPLLSDADPRVPRVFFQLGESLFRLGKTDEAARAYRRCFEHPLAEKLPDRLRNRSNIHAISAQIQFITTRTPSLKDQTSQTLQLISLPSPRPLPPEILELERLVDTHPSDAREEVSRFIQELHRMLLNFGQWQSVASRALQVGAQLPGKELQESFLSLGLDLLVAKKQWKTLVTETRKLRALILRVSPEFSSKLENLEGEGAYALLLEEEPEDFKTRIQQLEAFRKQYAKHSKADLTRIQEAELFSANGHTAEAEERWEQISRLPETSSARGAAHRHRIEQALQHGRLETAAAEELLFARWLQTQKRTGETTSLLHAAKIALSLSEEHSARVPLLNRIRLETTLCRDWTQETVETCLFISQNPLRDVLKAKAFSLTAHAKALLAVAELRSRLEVKERHYHNRFLEVLREIMTGWPSLPQTLRGRLEAESTPALQALFERHRNHLRDQRRVEANEWAIKRRARAIQEVEQLLLLAQTLGKDSYFAKATLAWASNLHQDAAQDLLRIRKPKGLSPQERASFEAQLAKLAAPFQARSKVLSHVNVEHPTAPDSEGL